jgi:tetratricopeptide (TPR) repeat protein
MEKSKKLYVKAIRYYNEGHLEKALETCEKCISENVNNASAVNLKGLLCYLKGELEGAQALWRMNYHINKDLVSKKYLEDSKNDEEKKKLYKEAIKLLKEIKIKEALELLELCKNSDFNTINVDNYITLCYIKLGDYSKAQSSIEQVLRVDRTNREALSHRKELIEFGIIKRERSVLKYSAAVIFCVFLLSAAAIMFNKNKSPETGSVVKNTAETQIVKNNEVIADKENTEKPVENVKEEFPSEAFKKAIDEANYEELYRITSVWQEKPLKDGELRVLEHAKEQLSKKGVEYFYNKGRGIFSSKDFNKAIDSFLKAYAYGHENYLLSHITYMLGVSYQRVGDFENSVKYYSEYGDKYPSGDYEQTIIYELALIYKDVDGVKSKSYAERLVNLYPKSIYNNSIINEILKR